MSTLVNPTEDAPLLASIVAPGLASTLARPGYLVQCGTSAGAVGVTCPISVGLPEGTCVAVEDTDGDADTNPITIAGNGSLIDGAASLVLSTSAAVAVLVLDGGQWRRATPERLVPGTLGTYERIAEQSGTGAAVVAMAGDVTGTSAASVVSTINGQAQGASVPIPALAIDWAAGTTFSKTLAAGANVFTFTNDADGQLIVVRVTGAGSTVTWPAVLWAGGVPPVQTPAGADVYTFVRIGVSIYGSVVQGMA